MPEARFEVALEPVAPEAGLPCGSSGAEAAELRFSANPGEPARALNRVASGGELSRVFLALKNVLRRAGAGTALVFDEVDAGVGGGVADRVGSVLAELAGSHQVLCITHLPQIAARADSHFRIAKATGGGRTAAAVERLDATGRRDEIARMAGGETITDATLEHAQALLDRAAGAPGPRGKARAKPQGSRRKSSRQRVDPPGLQPPRR
jgi:DNA repair protein RecN (Recombination protein N)